MNNDSGQFKPSENTCNDCFIGRNARFYRKADASKGVLVVRPGYVAFIALTPLSDQLTRLTVNWDSHFTSDESSMDGEPVDKYVSRMWNLEREAFDRLVAHLVEILGGVIWTPRQASVEVTPNGVHFIAENRRILFPSLSKTDHKSIDQLTGNWALHFVAESPTKYNAVRFDQSQLTCVKEYQCIQCGCRYSYSETASAKSKSTDAKTESYLLKRIRYRVRVEPCPNCGLVQPEMVGEKRARSHTIVFASSLLILMFVVVGIGLAFRQIGPAFFHGSLRGNEKWLMSIASYIFFVAFCGHLYIHYRIFDWIPEPRENQEPVESLQISKDVKEKKVSWRDLSISPIYALSVGILGAVSLLVAEFDRIVCNSPTNATCVPPVIGIDDELAVDIPIPYIDLPQRTVFQTRGTILNGEDLGLSESETELETEDYNWEKPESDQPFSWWIKCRLPNDPDLKGKTVLLKVELKDFNPSGIQLERTVRIKLSSIERAGERFLALWWGGIGMSAIAMLVCGFMFSRNAKVLATQGHSVNLRSEGIRVGVGTKL